MAAGVEVGVAAAVRGVGVRLVQPRGARPERAVDEQVAGQSAGAGRRRAGSRPAPAVGDGLAPVADDLDAVLDAAQLAASRRVRRCRGPRIRGPRRCPLAAASVERGDPGAGPAARWSAGHGRRRARGGGRRRSAAAAGRNRRRPAGPAPADAARWTPPPNARRRGPGRRAGPRRRASRSSVVGGAALAASPTRPSRAPRSGRRDARGRSRRSAAGSAARMWPARRSRPASVRPVAVRWTWLSTKAGATKPPSRSTTSASGNWARPDVVAAQPGDGAVADRHRGGVRHRRAVHPAADEEASSSQSGLRGKAWRLDIAGRRSPRRRCSRHGRRQACRLRRRWRR